MISIVGCGNMGEAIAAGLIASGRAPGEIIASHPRAERRAELEKKLRIVTTADNAHAVAESDLALIAVKPQLLASVLPGLAAAAKDKVVVSLAAGTPAAVLEAALPGARVVRAMPNTPAQVRAGVTGLWAGPGVSAEDRARVTAVFQAVGAAVWVPREEQFHALTAVSACGPAFLFVIAEALADGGVAAGLPRATASLLAAHTVAGAGRMLVEAGEHPGALKDKVASPGGTTIHGLAALEKAGVRGGVIAAVRAAADRSTQMAGGPVRRRAPARVRKKRK